MYSTKKQKVQDFKISQLPECYNHSNNTVKKILQYKIFFRQSITLKRIHVYPVDYANT